PFTASVTGTATADGRHAAMAVGSAAAEKGTERAIATASARPRHRLSPLTLRILAINVVALALLGGGLFYLGAYQHDLIDNQVRAMRTQAEVLAAALGEGAVSGTGTGDAIVPGHAREMMRRLVAPTGSRARLFDAQGALIGDTRVLGNASGAIEVD